MIKFQLKRNVIAAIAVAIMFGSYSVTSSAGAIGVNNISGEIGFFGAYTADNANLAQATELLFPQPVFIAAGAGDFASAFGSNATFDTISFDPAVPGNVLTFAGGGGFTSTSLTVDFQSSSAIDITLTGYWSLDGFEDTLGKLILTADSVGNSGLFTFSASGAITTIPVPAAVWLLGSAIAGLGLMRRRV